MTINKGLWYDAANEMLFYGNEIVCEVGYAGPALDLIVSLFNDAIKEMQKTIDTDNCVHSLSKHLEWQQKLSKLKALSTGHAEFR